MDSMCLFSEIVLQMYGIGKDEGCRLGGKGLFHGILGANPPILLPVLPKLAPPPELAMA